MQTTIPTVSSRNRLAAKRLALCLAAVCTIACARTSVCTVSEHRGPDRSIAPRVLIVYQSTYGSTKQYADWIHREIPSRMVDIETCRVPDFGNHDVIVFGSPVRMGRIVLAPFIVDSWPKLKGKTVFLFTVSGMPPEHPGLRKLYEANLPGNLRNDIRYFPLRGRMLRSALSARDRAFVSVGRMMQGDETLKNLMGEDFDAVKRERLIPLLDQLRNPTRPESRIDDYLP